MYDPMTLAHEVKNPYAPAHKMRNKAGEVTFSYRPNLIDVWHVDPESDGTDDSCGWSSPNLTRRQLDRIKSMAKDEAENPWFQQVDARAIEDPVMATALLDGMIYAVSLAIGVKFEGKPAEQLRNRLLHVGFDHARSWLCYKSGYHGNSNDDAYWRQEHASHTFALLGRQILKELRPWYRHPRWHVHHWKVNCIPVRNFKRWAFNRCTECGGRFRYGQAPVSNGWSGRGPRWFASEDVKHMRCDLNGGPAKAAQP